MNDREFCKELLKSKQQRELQKGSQLRIIILGLVSIPMLASGSAEVIAFGTFFLGLAVGSYSTTINWRKHAQENWQYMSKFLDWKKIKAVSESHENDKCEDGSWCDTKT
jgi:hypothetical protein